jgi:hypothetical protein
MVLAISSLSGSKRVMSVTMVRRNDMPYSAQRNQLKNKPKLIAALPLAGDLWQVG